MISRKLIAPVAGALVVPCVAGLAGGTTAAGARSTSLEVRSPAFGDAVLASHLQSDDVLIGHEARITGALAPTLTDEAITLQVHRRGAWRAVAGVGAAAAGSFELAFRPRHLGSELLRLEVSGPDGMYTTPASSLTVSHEVLVSWYGPGGETACGEELTVRQYLDCGDRCPACLAGFNPGCKAHHRLYFAA